MASGKRASMREGPLAALFRKTDEDGLEPEAAPRAAPSRPRPRRRRREPEPATRRAAPVARPPATHAAAAPRSRACPLAARSACATPSPRRSPTTSWLARARAAPTHEDPYARSPEPSYDAAPQRTASPSCASSASAAPASTRSTAWSRPRSRASSSSRSTPTCSRCSSPTADITLHIGPQLTRGLGAGSDPDLGRAAAMEDYDRIKALLKGSRHGLHHRRRRRRHRHGRGADRRAHRPRARRADRRHRHQAVRLRGLAARGDQAETGVRGARPTRSTR